MYASSFFRWCLLYGRDMTFSSIPSVRSIYIFCELAAVSASSSSSSNGVGGDAVVLELKGDV